MQAVKRSRLGWTAEDQAVYAKWRRSVAILYGAVGLMFLVGAGTYYLTDYLANYGPKSAAALLATRAP